MIRNVRIYDTFLKYSKKYVLKRFSLNLTRTFIYNFGRNNIYYYRKRTNVPRKLFLTGKSKIFKVKRINFLKINLKKYKMRDISNILYEYIMNSTSFVNDSNNNYDIAKKDSKIPIIIDSKVRKDELVTMYFENHKKSFKNKFKNVFWINDTIQTSEYNNSKLN